MQGPAPVPGGRRIDLHAHTTFSDGVLTPEALVARAVDKRLAALAITDHDTVEAIPRARAAAGTALQLVPGIEMSTAFEGADLHILGYYIDPNHAALCERLVGFQDERRRRAGSIVERLRELGLALELDEVLALAGPGVIGRPHVAEAMVRAGLVSGFDEAFERYLGQHAPAYVARPAFSPREAIALIHAADGVSVLAHPGSQMPDGVIERLRASGLRGIEVWHPQHGASTVRRYQALAQRLGLLTTGGSDFHGEHRSVDLGELPVPISVLDPLKQAAGVSG
jgi:predicted metal-dependent phosphoesterase TrpH